MGKTGKWIRNLMTGKIDDKEKESKYMASNEQIISAGYANKHQYHPTTRANEKRRWSFCWRRDTVFVERITATATAPSGEVKGAAVKIQSVFRAHLARRALKALKGLVKMQALVRGHLVRKQANATLKCMESLMTAQTSARAKRLQSTRIDLKHFTIGKSAHENRDLDICPLENINIMDMNPGNYKPTVTKSRTSYSNYTPLNFNKTEHIKIYTQISPPSSSVITTTDHMSPRTCSNHFERYSFSPAKIGPFVYPRSDDGESFYDGYNNQLNMYPNYMADTESSRAKLRSNSAPKQRPVEMLGRQTGRRRSSYVSKVVRMQ